MGIADVFLVSEARQDRFYNDLKFREAIEVCDMMSPGTKTGESIERILDGFLNERKLNSRKSDDLVAVELKGLAFHLAVKTVLTAHDLENECYLNPLAPLDIMVGSLSGLKDDKRALVYFNDLRTLMKGSGKENAERVFLKAVTEILPDIVASYRSETRQIETRSGKKQKQLEYALDAAAEKQWNILNSFTSYVRQMQGQSADGVSLDGFYSHAGIKKNGNGAGKVDAAEVYELVDQSENPAQVIQKLTEQYGHVIGTDYKGHRENGRGTAVFLLGSAAKPSRLELHFNDVVPENMWCVVDGLYNTAINNADRMTSNSARRHKELFQRYLRMD
jgi:hypothetical protein